MSHVDPYMYLTENDALNSKLAKMRDSIENDEQRRHEQHAVPDNASDGEA